MSNENAAHTPASTAALPAVERALETHQATLWFVVCLSGLADVALTAVGLRLGLAESNPFAAAVIARFGLAGMVAVKAAAAGLAVWGWVVLPARYALAVPAFVGAPWVVACLVNAVVILVTVV